MNERASEVGTPAALRRLGDHELQSAQEVERLKSELADLRAAPEPEGDAAVSMWRARISRVIEDIGNAQDAWIKALRALREFDKAVPKSTREGEKISVEDAKEAFAQLQLSIFLGVESFILQVAQEALRCDSEEQFHEMCATKIRECVKGAIEVAKRESALPDWVA